VLTLKIGPETFPEMSVLLYTYIGKFMIKRLFQGESD
jgi:hypothetical protein